MSASTGAEHSVPDADAGTPVDPRAAALAEAASYSMIGLLSTDGGVDDASQDGRVTHVGASAVNPRLPPALIQQTIRAEYGKMRTCYENGLRASPSLEGQIVTRFVIGRDGSVSGSTRRRL